MIAFLFSLFLFISTASLTVITPNIGWYSLPYQGVQSSNFFVVADKLLIIRLVGCNCPGDQFYLLDNGIPLLLFENCSFLTGGLYSCDGLVSDPWKCAGFSGNTPPVDDKKTFEGMKSILSTGKNKDQRNNLKNEKALSESTKKDPFCVAGGYLLPGKHNITAISISTLYPFNMAYIRADSVCSKDGVIEACCLFDGNTLSSKACTDAIVG